MSRDKEEQENGAPFDRDGVTAAGSPDRLAHPRKLRRARQPVSRLRKSGGQQGVMLALKPASLIGPTLPLPA